MNEKRRLFLERKWNDISFDSKWFRFLVIDAEGYIIFIDDGFDIDWETTDEYDAAENDNKDVQKHHEIMNSAAELECIPNGHHTEDIRLGFKRMIGEGMARSFAYDYMNAKKMLDIAEQYILQRNEEKSREWYLAAAGVTGLICIALSLLFWKYRYILAYNLGELVLFLLLASMAGGIGALFSIIMRIGKVNLNVAAGRNVHYLEGVSRIIAGCIAGVLAALLIQLEIVLPVFKTVVAKQYAIIFFGLIIGMSERFIPSIISNVTERKVEISPNKSVEV